MNKFDKRLALDDFDRDLRCAPITDPLERAFRDLRDFGVMDEFVNDARVFTINGECFDLEVVR